MCRGRVDLHQKMIGKGNWAPCSAFRTELVMCTGEARLHSCIYLVANGVAERWSDRTGRPWESRATSCVTGTRSYLFSSSRP